MEFNQTECFNRNPNGTFTRKVDVAACPCPQGDMGAGGLGLVVVGAVFGAAYGFYWLRDRRDEWRRRYNEAYARHATK